MRTTPNRHYLLGLIAALASALFVVESAQAGTYIMRTCNVPGSEKAPVGPWRWENSYYSIGFDNCGTGGGFGFEFPAQLRMTRVSTAALLLQRDPSGPKSAIAIRGVRLWLIARLSGGGAYLYVVTTAVPSGSSSQNGLFSPPGGDSLESPSVSPVLPSDTGAFRVVLACSGSVFDDCYPTSRRPLEVRGAEVTLEEEVAPSGSITGGTAVAGGAQSGLRSITYAVKDDESGIARIEALVGDTVVGIRDLRATCSYADFAACPNAESDDLRVDTRAAPDGDHPVRLRVTDAAGNTSIAQWAAPVRISNGSATRLTARFAATRRKTLLTTYGKPVSVRGRLTDSMGRPLGNAQVQVQERPAIAGAGTRDRGLVGTDGDGRWQYTRRGKASSTQLIFRYGPTIARLRIKVRASVTFRVSLDGTLVRFGGRVVSRPLPKQTLRVFVQGRARGAGWQTFATPRASRAGQFSGRYRLRVRRPGVTLQFRVRVAAVRRYPFATGSSRVLSRIVR